MIPGMMKDKMPGQGVQPWSVGDIYPLVIARVERYNNSVHPAVRKLARDFPDSVYGELMRDSRNNPELVSVYWDVLNADDDMSGFASYDDAYAAAKGYLARKAEMDVLRKVGYGGPVPYVLSPFNPAAYDAELAADMVEDVMLAADGSEC